MELISELLEQLNNIDECTTIEAKKGSAIDRSIMETVCSFANEPGLGGGYLLLGITMDIDSLFPSYIVSGIQNPDKLQLEIATQSASIFNQSVRPDIEIEKTVDGKLVMKVFVHELPDAQKPLYFKNVGLPKGAYRRIGSSDQTCTDDDLFIFYNKEDSFDSSLVKETSLEDISEEALSLYRSLRKNVNQFAEELNYSDEDLLQSLGCSKKEKGQSYLTYTGLLVFGKRQALRRLLPLVRVDYVRVPGNEWIPDPDNRFTTIDMRGPLIELVQRTFSAIADDLPKGFLLPEGQVQAESIGLPSKVLREAIVNAFMHRTYRENQPIQIIRYGNRIEIKNPGFSLKPEDDLGEPGSRNRNPFIAAIFHDTNLAETKGSGIRTMRLLMERAAMVAPTFESDHGANQFTTRLLLHHFLSEADIDWLQKFKAFGLNDAQKRALIFIREVGAIDNATYRQINGLDLIRASVDLRMLRDTAVLEQKGKGRSTYYIPNVKLPIWTSDKKIEAPVPLLSAPVKDLSTPVKDVGAPVDQSLVHQLPDYLKQIVAALPQRNTELSLTENAILALCSYKALKSSELSAILGKSEKYILRNFITPLRKSGKLEYMFPEMSNHPQQAYKSTLFIKFD